MQAGQITFNLLVTLAIKLPLVAFFYKKSKRQQAITAALIINLITWVLATIMWLKNPDVNQVYLRIGVTLLEAFAYWFFMGRNWKRALLLAIISNAIVYFITKWVTLPDSLFQKKDNMIR